LSGFPILSGNPGTLNLSSYDLFYLYKIALVFNSPEMRWFEQGFKLGFKIKSLLNTSQASFVLLTKLLKRFPMAMLDFRKFQPICQYEYETF